MATIRNWQAMKDMSSCLLVERTGEDLTAWNQRIQNEHLQDEKNLRVWLAHQGVTGYAQNLLVMERFGYPDFILASANDLIDGQYAGRPRLRLIFDAIIAAAAALGEVTIQARKTYISLVTSRRTFARLQPTTRDRLYLALRLPGPQPAGRLQPSKIHESTPLQVSLTSLEDLDAEKLAYLKQAYDHNR